ncbi:MAG: DUF4138 domain-containing protein [Cellulophaga sp.]
MKNLLLLWLIFPLFIFAQKEIEVSEDYTTVLIFPAEIEEPILGNEQEYLIKTSRNKSNIGKRTIRLGYLKIDKVEKNTNLTVFTKDGNSYEYLLKYASTPKKLTHYIKLSESANNLMEIENKESDNTEKVKVKESYYSEGVVTEETEEHKQPEEDYEKLYITDKISYMNKMCELVNNNSKKIYKIYDKSSNIKLSLKQISYSKDELYFHLRIENKGGQTFDVDFINTRLARGYKGVSTDQSIPLTPLLVYERPSRVKGKSASNFIMVFKKFSINDKKEFQIDLAEKEGERDLLLRINNNLINNPVKI